MRDYRLILKKELTDILRDKRSFIMLFVPVLLFPMMFLLLDTQSNTAKVYEQGFTYTGDYTRGTDEETIFNLYAAELEKIKKGDQVEALREQGIEIKESVWDEPLFARVDVGADDSPDALRQEIAQALRRGETDLVIRIRNNGEKAQITLLYSESSTKSTIVADALETMIKEGLEQQVDETLRAQYGFETGDLQPYAYSGKIELSKELGEKDDTVLKSVAPMLLVVIIMSSGMSVAVDLYTGEKERGTFESLMTTQTSRLSILTAKFTATLFISLLGMVTAVVAYVISNVIKDSQDAGPGLSFEQVMTLALVCLMLSVFAVSVMTLIGLHAKTVKEAQSQMSLMTLLPTILSGATMFKNAADFSALSMWIPVYNAIACIKMIFNSAAEPTHILGMVASSLVYSALMWVLCVRMLHSEKLLQG